MVAVATVVDRTEDGVDTTPADTKAQGQMEVAVDRLMEVATRATEVATAADKEAAATTTTEMKDRSSDKEVAEATKETRSRAPHPMATTRAHRAVATMIEVIAEVEEASTKDLEVEITSLQSPAPLSLLFLRIQKMLKLKSAASTPTNSK
jgi:hypothetical protein